MAISMGGWDGSVTARVVAVAVFAVLVAFARAASAVRVVAVLAAAGRFL